MFGAGLLTSNLLISPLRVGVGCDIVIAHPHFDFAGSVLLCSRSHTITCERTVVQPRQGVGNGGDGACSPTWATKRARRPANECALRPKTTTLTSLLPMRVVSPPIVVKPADLVRRVPPTTSMNQTASTDRAPPTSTLSRPKHASQPRKTAHFRKQTLDSLRRESQRAHPALPRRPKRGTRKECPTTPGTQSQRTFRYGTPPWTRTGLPTRLHGCGCAATKSIQTDTGTGAYSYNDPSLNSTSIVLVASS